MVDAELDRMERDAREVAEARADLETRAMRPDGGVYPLPSRIEPYIRALRGHPTADVLALVAEVRRLRASRAGVLAQLKATQWCDRDPPFLRCPECGEIDPATYPDSEGHDPDCDLAAAIRRAERED